MQSLASAQRVLQHYPRFFANAHVMVQVASLLIDETDQLATPYIHFKICVGTMIVGAVNLRLTKNKEIVQFYGHLGFEVVEKYRGHGLARQACELLVPYARALGFRRIVITCHPANTASRCTIENLGARFITYRDFPAKSSAYDSERLIYCWEIASVSE
ncbi:hypothetical protein TDB9533_03468 [Thalassocella blandensis]|nr:hypothetical protein TDB9533_03468 [Thalassocella blandensis]